MKNTHDLNVFHEIPVGLMIEAEKQKASRIEDLNVEIERGLQQLDRGEKISAEDVFKSISLKN